jgi:heat shock protein HslJ
MHKSLWSIPVLVFLFILSSCGNTRKLTAQTETLFRGNWRVMELQGQVLSDTTRSNFEFSPGRIAGSMGCNRLSAGFVAGKDQTIRFTEVAQTRMACPDQIAALETSVLDALTRSTNWEMKGGELWLGKGDSTLMKLRSF